MTAKRPNQAKKMATVASGPNASPVRENFSCFFSSARGVGEGRKGRRKDFSPLGMHRRRYIPLSL